MPAGVRSHAMNRTDEGTAAAADHAHAKFAIEFHDVCGVVGWKSLRRASCGARRGIGPAWTYSATGRPVEADL